MKNRIPTYQNRVQLLPVEGQENVFDMIRADEPIEPGTPLDMATLLRDATAALYGFDENGTPDNVFESIFYSMFGSAQTLYKWQRTKTVYSVVQSDLISTWGSMLTGVNSGGNLWVAYADSYKTNGDGRFALVNPTTVGVPYSDPDTGDAIVRGKYFVVSRYFDSIDAEAASARTVFLAAQNLEFSSRHDDSYYVRWRYYYTLTQTSTLLSEIVTSTDPNAYPVEGDGWTYTAVGTVPASAGFAKIEVGSYTGTNVYGQSSRNTITLQFKPKLVYIKCRTNVYGGLFLGDGLSNSYRQYGFTGFEASALIAGSYNYAALSGNTLLWYSSSSAARQLNSAETYDYIAIG